VVGLLITKIKKCSLLSLAVKKIKIDEYLTKLQARTWLPCALSSSFNSVVASRGCTYDFSSN